MQQRYLFLFCRAAVMVMLTGLLVLGPTGCSGGTPAEPVEEKAPPPPPPSKDQLKGEMLTAFRPIMDNVQNGGEMSMIEASVNAFKQAVQKVSGTRTTNPNADPAISEMKGVVEETFKLAKNYDRWRFQKGAILCFHALDPSNKKYDTIEKTVDLMLAMPGVKLKGFTQVDADTYAFFNVVDREERFSYRVREGEEFHNGHFQFVRIIGNQQSVEVLYKDADYLLTVGGPRERNLSQETVEKMKQDNSK